MAGVASADKHSVEVQNATYLHNLSYAASVLATENIIGLIEPINQESVPGYWLHDYDKGTFTFCKIDSYITSRFIFSCGFH